jgi:NAD(P)-dependent dehydrogenase (short-subunit alcohol dehydrogenase family)
MSARPVAQLPPQPPQQPPPQPQRPIALQHSTATRVPLRVVVTGGNRGFGAGMARELAARGHSVVVLARRAPNPSSVPPNSRLGFVVCDVRDYASVAGAAHTARDMMSGIDVWINNAAAYPPPFYGDMGMRRAVGLPDADEWADGVRACCDTNLLGCVWGTRAAADVMRDQVTTGHVFNVLGSGSDGSTCVGHALYGATKAAAAIYSRSARAEADALSLPLRIHDLRPGPMDTRLYWDHVESALGRGRRATDDAWVGGGWPMRLRRAAFSAMCLDPDEVAAEAADRIEGVVYSTGEARQGHRALDCYTAPLLRRLLGALTGRAARRSE